MPRLARCAALLPLLAALLFASSPAAEAKCSVDDLQISGAYICYEADSIVGYEDGTVRDSPAVNKDTAIANGISEGSWYYLKPGEQNGHSFVMFTGTADRNGSTAFDIDSDGDGATYVAYGTVESKQVCSLKASQTPYWTANCLVLGAEDFFMELEMVASEDDECETTAIYQNLVVPKITGFANGYIATGLCEKIPDESFLEPIDYDEEVDQDGPIVRATAEGDCASGYTLVHEVGELDENGQKIGFLDPVRCMQFCVTEDVLPIVADFELPILPGSCSAEGYDTLFTETGLDILGESVIVDLFISSDDD